MVGIRRRRTTLRDPAGAWPYYRSKPLGGAESNRWRYPHSQAASVVKAWLFALELAAAGGCGDAALRGAQNTVAAR